MNYQKKLLRALPILVAASGCYESFDDPVNVYDFYDSTALGMSQGVDGRVWTLRTTWDDEYYNMRAERTDNGGESWEDGFSSGITQLHQTFIHGAILADQSDAETAYVLRSGQVRDAPGSGDPGPIYNRASRTTNGGRLWVAMDTWAETGLYRDFHLAQNPLDGTIVGVFAEADPYYDNICRVTRSLDGGTTWSEHDYLVNVISSRHIGVHGLQYTDTGVLVAIFGTANPDPDDPPYWYVKRSLDNGATWSALIRINSTTSGYWSYGADLVHMVGETLHAVWSSDVNYKHAYSDDGGLTWSENEILSWDLTMGHHLAANASGTHLMWTYFDFNDFGNNLYHRSFDGTSWSSARRMNNRQGSVRGNGGLASDAGEVFLGTWTEYRNNDTFDKKIVSAASDPTDEQDVAIRMVDSSTFTSTTRGSLIQFEYTVTNYMEEEQTVDVWVGYLGQDNGINGTLSQFSDQVLAPEESRTYTSRKVVPSRAPYQAYDLTAHVGNAPGDVWRSDTFVATVDP